MGAADGGFPQGYEISSSIVNYFSANAVRFNVAVNGGISTNPGCSQPPIFA